MKYQAQIRVKLPVANPPLTLFHVGFVVFALVVLKIPSPQNVAYAVSGLLGSKTISVASEEGNPLVNLTQVSPASVLLYIPEAE